MKRVGWLLLLVAGCGAPVVDGPTANVRAYADALQGRDPPAAWALLDEEARRGRTSAEHAELMAANAEELGQQARALIEAVDADRVTARARIPLATGETVVLVLENGQWRIDGGVLDAAGLGTPLEAVTAFRRALMRRDLPGLERVLARQTRAEWEDEVRRLLESTVDLDDLQLEVQGNHARVRTTGGGTIELVRESGEWRVVDVHAP